MDDPIPQPCGCEPGEAGFATPRPLVNPPGQPALKARVGDHGAFLESLLDDVIRAPQLDGLKIREGDDFTIGLLDAWAVTLDVLTFYQERIANEGYLGTATERRSVLELARSIGYELSPGVAAEAHLAFGLDLAGGQAGAPGLPEAMRLDAGLAAQSIPGPGESPATFETVEPIEARAAWNSVGARLTEAPRLGTGTTEIWLAGIEAGLKRGDHILLVGGDRRKDRKSELWDVRPVETVTLDPGRDRTHVTWREPLGSTKPAMDAAAGDGTLEVWHLGASARLFGAAAPDVRSLHRDIRVAYQQSDPDDAVEWDDLKIGKIPGAKLDKDGTGGTVQIEGAQPLVEGDWLVFARAAYVELYDVVSAAENSAEAFTLTGKTTLTRLRGENLKSKFNSHVRDTALWRATRRFVIAEPPAPPTVSGATVELERLVPGLKPGQTVAVSEALPPPAPPGVPPVKILPGEVLTIKTVVQNAASTTITFDRALARAYPRAAFRAHFNVARSTHGAAREEVLGSGSAALAFQTFTLSGKPLTYVSAETASGRATTLQIWVNRLLWREVESFVGQPPDAKIYVTRRADDGTVTIVFGDGINGARLPSGSENIVARYRVGIGAPGWVHDRQIALLMTRPLGLSDVFNPAPSTGGADPEPRDAARASAPGTVTALGRIVSLSDFEDFALGFAGIAKARAARLWTGHGWLAHLTVASVSGAPLPPKDPLLETLRKAIDRARDITQSFRVDDHRPCKVRMDLKLKAAPDRRYDDVRDALALKLATAFGRAAQGLAHPITSSAIMALAHSVPGVVAIDLDKLEDDHGNVLANGGLIALPARMSGTAVLPADLLLLDQLNIIRMDQP
ncbi:putative baseplate assembly protein [Sphingomonas sp. LB-2]|uniref:putative baseplate assembly protein n=1 Tax=Sphingomonas caeni TaxID=2984949 RepID=UPI00222F303E|nr:putative baseplate assembly protein [Sphingomonas caeni]MCW3846492.1 putative baseplate assembly protein [Sphingomonas caeni]